MLQCAHKEKEDEDCELVKMDVNNAGLRIFLKIA